MTSSILAAAAGGLLYQPPVARDRGYNLQEYAQHLASTFTGPQLAVYNAGTRFRMLSCGRRFGKTYLSLGQLQVWALGKPGGTYWYVTSTYKAAKRIAWAQLRSMVPQHLVHQVNHSELTLTLINGASISLMGADNPDSLRGSSLSGAIIDEAAYVHPRVWQEVLRPSLSDQQGPCWHISTPAGYNHFHQLWEGVAQDATWSRHQYTTLEGGQVPWEEVEAAKRDMDSRTFRQEYLASFESLSSRVYVDFADYNVSDAVQDTTPELLIGLDFNVGMMAGVLGNLVGDELHIYDEISMPNSNTEEVATYLAQRYPRRPMYCYPDPTGSARKSSASGATDHGILRNFAITVITPNAPWAVKDKINATNFMVCTADGTRRLFIHPRCVNTIKALRSVTYKAGTDAYVIDKAPGLEHWSDALGYLILGAANHVQPYGSGQANYALY